MKLDLPVPTINVIVQALQTLQQQTAVAIEAIQQQVLAEQEKERSASARRGLAAEDGGEGVDGR